MVIDVAEEVQKMRDSELVFHHIHLLYYKCYMTNLNRGESYIESSDRISSINKKDKKCFEYQVTVVLHSEEIKNDLQRIAKIKLFINAYNQKGLSYRSEKDGWKKFEKNNVTNSLNVLYAKKEKMYPAYVLK